MSRGFDGWTVVRGVSVGAIALFSKASAFIKAGKVKALAAAATAAAGATAVAKEQPGKK